MSTPDDASALTFPSGSELTYKAEGGGTSAVLRPHWPGGESGVTIAPGYDMSQRSYETICQDMAAAGVDKEIYSRFEDAAKLHGEGAQTWVSQHVHGKNSPDWITGPQSKKLFLNVYPLYVEGGLGVVGARQVVEGWESDWNGLSATVKEVLVDLNYRGDLAGRHRALLEPAIDAEEIEELRRALGDYDYWQSMTNLEPGATGPNGRFVDRAVFIGGPRPPRLSVSIPGPTRVPSETQTPTPAARQPGGASNAQAIRARISVTISLINAHTGVPWPYLRVETVKIDGNNLAPTPRPPPWTEGAPLWKFGIEDKELIPLCVMSNGLGRITVPITAHQADKGFKIEVGIKDQPVVREVSAKEHASVPSAGVFRTRTPYGFRVHRSQEAQANAADIESGAWTVERTARQFSPAGKMRGVQQRLAWLGYDPGFPDGKGGKKTESAIRAFQNDHHGLTPTGTVDDATRAALDHATPGDQASIPVAPGGTPPAGGIVPLTMSVTVDVPSTKGKLGDWGSIPKEENPFSLYQDCDGEAEIVLFVFPKLPAPTSKRPWPWKES